MAAAHRPADTSEPGVICVGAVAGAHGVRGGVRIKPFTHAPEGVAAYGKVRDESGNRVFDLRLTGKAKGVVLAKLSGVETREAAEALKGLRLYVDRSLLPPADADEFYHADLIGLPVEDAEGRPLGVVHALHDFGAGDLLEVKTNAAKLVVLPFTEAVVPVVDVAVGRVVVVPPPGLMDDQDAE
jgi:16S rRNA processing protein RimM